MLHEDIDQLVAMALSVAARDPREETVGLLAVALGVYEETTGRPHAADKDFEQLDMIAAAWSRGPEGDTNLCA